MTAKLIPLDSNTDVARAPAPAAALAAWTPPPAPPPDSGTSPFARYGSMLRRFKWLILSIAAVGTALGVYATRFLAVEYDATAKVAISVAGAGGTQNRGPIRSAELLSPTGFAELLQSFAVSDAVVAQLGLNITPVSRADSARLAGLALAPSFRSGRYTVTADASSGYVLTGDGNKELERGVVGDSIGRSAGLLWAPTRQQLPPNAVVRFDLTTVRDASIRLTTKLQTQLPEGSSFLVMTLSGDEPHRTSTTLNAWVRELVRVALDLKRQGAHEFVKTLEDQREFAARRLRTAEGTLQNFRVSAITKPSEGALPVAAGSGVGLEMTRDPVISQYFDQKVTYDNLRHDREVIEQAIAGARRSGTLNVAALSSVPSVASGAGAENLRAAILQLQQKEIALRELQNFYKEEYKGVKDQEAAIATLQRQTIPQLAQSFANELRRRENDLSGRIQNAGRDIQDIPTRTIEEARLRREYEISQDLYKTLQNRYVEASLAEASTVPDLSVLDTAVAPTRPKLSKAPRVILMAFGASLAFGLFLAFALDFFDKRLRYPDQVTKDLRLDIVGAVPMLPTSRNGREDIEAVSQLVESFRALRLNVAHAIPGRSPTMLTVTSPEVNDGKSFISTNLALSFSEAGYRTLLIDGDIRRGELHTTFDVPQSPGFLDYLVGRASPDDIIRPTTHEGLSLVPCGQRHRRGPELLQSPMMARMLHDLAANFDVVICDSAPLGAGIDPFALGTATENLLLVLRSGSTDRKLAQAKLAVLDRLPVRVVGAVLNGFKTDGVYRYYSYISGYSMEQESEDDGPIAANGVRITKGL